jgi:hypothetical protein
VSVLIKGIELPEKVQVLELHSDGKVFTRKGYLVGEAVELPEKHGRLIDADADSLRNKLKIINEAEHQIYGRASWGFTAKCIHAFDDAPTVIETEGSE